jgi:hypothetical protein
MDPHSSPEDCKEGGLGRLSNEEILERIKQRLKKNPIDPTKQTIEEYIREQEEIERRPNDNIGPTPTSDDR